MQASHPAPDEAQQVRDEVRAFLAEERAASAWQPCVSSWTAFDAGFSQRAGAAGLIGVNLPTEFGGRGLGTVARFVIAGELIAAGAPCGAHWAADRQSGPQILRHGSAAARRDILPRIARGECFFGIAVSEPDSGSDLASVRSRATRVDGGWAINGAKIWTTHAHRVHYLIVLVRTSGTAADRQKGLSQFIVDMSTPGVTVRPILDLSGSHEFNEVVFDNCIVPDDMMVGEEGSGWAMVTSELAFERSGPDRFLSAYPLLAALVSAVGPQPQERASVEIGRLFADLAPLLRQSTGIAGQIERGDNPVQMAAMLKDVGTVHEQDVVDSAHRLSDLARDDSDFQRLLREARLQAPSFSIRGGTREILRGIIARGQGLR